jgi:hypothetical protein
MIPAGPVTSRGEAVTIPPMGALGLWLAGTCLAAAAGADEAPGSQPVVGAAPAVAEAAPAPVDVPRATEALERAWAASGQPEVLLALAALHDGAGDCAAATAAYRRFFTACRACATLAVGAERFERLVAKCGPGAESIPAPAAPEAGLTPRPGDATRAEVQAALRRAREVDPSAAGRLMVTLAEAGADAPASLLNALRREAWQLLLQRPAQGPELLELLERARVVAPERHEAWLGRVMFAEKEGDQDKRDALRRELMDALASAAHVPVRDASRAGCLPNPEREWGYLTVNTTPWSEIYLNGQPRGTTPVAKVSVLAGCVTLKALSPVTGQAVVKNVVVRPNRNLILRIDLASGAERQSYD